MSQGGAGNVSKRVILVLGMHRSGTSAIAGLLNTLGVELGKNLLSAAADNPKGFWEHAAVKALDDDILHALGRTWHDPRPLPPLWWQRQELEVLRIRLQEIVRGDFQEADLWALKDPRLCRLLPLWRPQLESQGHSIRVILVLRNPMEVAASLERRNGMPGDHSHLLWLQHMTEAEHGTRGLPRVVVTYQQLLDDWRATTGRISAALDLALPERSGADAFIDSGLRHHVAEGRSGSPLENLALACYEAAVVCPQDRLAATLEPFAAQAIRLAADIEPWLAEIESLIAERDRARVAALAGEHCARERAQLQAEVARVKATVSWRVTGPLRAAWNLLRRPPQGPRQTG